MVSSYAGIDGDIELNRFPCTDCNGLWQITTSPNSLMSDIHHIGSGYEGDRIAGVRVRDHCSRDGTPSVVIIIGRAAYAATIFSWEIEHGSTGHKARS